MMKKGNIQQQALFELIFSDAHVVDIDLFAWDKRIALYVLADHAGRTVDNRLPMFIIDFVEVQSWDVKFNHISHEPPIELGPDEHIQWLVDNFQIRSVQSSLHILLSGHSASPQMKVVCEHVNIRELPLDVADRLFPGWAKPFKGFIRPGLDALALDRGARKRKPDK